MTVAGTGVTSAGAAWVTANGAVCAKLLLAIVPTVASISKHGLKESDLKDLGNVLAIVAQLTEVA